MTGFAPPASALTDLGYTDREAAFLTRVARHGGYFVRRQFLDWIARRQGQTVVDFTDRLVSRRHATVQTFCRTTHVYHLSAKALFAGLDAGPALRRRRPAVSVKARLMALDVVALCPDVTFLATEAERVAVCDVLGIARGYLPQWHSPARLRTSNPRYFPADVLVGLENGPKPELVCVFIDDGASSSAGFTSHLRRYARLFQARPTARLIYVSDSVRKTEGAAQTVRQTLMVDQANEAHDAEGIRALREYFELRRAYEGQVWDALDTAKIDRLRILRHRFKSDLDGVYERWLVGGDAVWSSAPPLRFDTLVLPHSYAAIEVRRRRS